LRGSRRLLINTGCVIRIEIDLLPRGSERRYRQADLGKNEEPEWMLEWRLAAYEGAGLTKERAELGDGGLPLKIELQNRDYYCASQIHARSAQVPGRRRIPAARDLTELVSP